MYEIIIDIYLVILQYVNVFILLYVLFFYGYVSLYHHVQNYVYRILDISINFYSQNVGYIYYDLMVFVIKDYYA